MFHYKIIPFFEKLRSWLSAQKSIRVSPFKIEKNWIDSLRPKIGDIKRINFDFGFEKVYFMESSNVEMNFFANNKAKSNIINPLKLLYNALYKSDAELLEPISSKQEIRGLVVPHIFGLCNRVVSFYSKKEQREKIMSIRLGGVFSHGVLPLLFRQSEKLKLQFIFHGFLFCGSSYLFSFPLFSYLKNQENRDMEMRKNLENTLFLPFERKSVVYISHQKYFQEMRKT